MHNSMICYVVCLKAAIAEGEFSVERRRLELKPQGGKVQAGEFQFAVPVLPMAPEDAQGENCSNKSLFGPPCLERDIVEGSLPHVLQPFQRNVPIWSQGAGTLLLVLCSLAEQHKQGHVTSEFIISKSREGMEKCLYLCISLLRY